MICNHNGWWWLTNYCNWWCCDIASSGHQIVNQDSGWWTIHNIAMIHDDKAATSHNEPSNKKKGCGHVSVCDPERFERLASWQDESCDRHDFHVWLCAAMFKIPNILHGCDMFFSKNAPKLRERMKHFSNICIFSSLLSAFCVFGSLEQTWSRLVNKSLLLALWTVLLMLRPDFSAACQWALATCTLWPAYWIALCNAQHF